ncbi:branched-chain alpha-keto acid dehydrogenase subunit E2 [Embleya scabrispora]|uniref:Dihydrolipoamide acetyltransferase component of pyruvate dehydrogenase complex n=1 Tax=Embleya scabrispora TaxID=159449 RepID=A0A1T3P7M6_9ACTN|nr:dihydrolipoamide acetyltransferase family protein [Embleya scabrispora]OPC85043.1 branched-chain alpha-keto acid dehydrogenase subunit E2 [Embleya scabrispora]
MPDVGEGLEEADIVVWHVKVGDEVHDGQVMVEVETAKALVELPCPYDGVVTELLAAEGDTVAVGAPIIAVAPAGTAVAAAEPERERALAADLVPEPVAEPAPTKEPAKEAGKETRTAVLVGYGVRTSSGKRRPRRADAATPTNGAARPAPAGGSLALAKPPVRKLARDLGVDLASVQPSGPGGTVTREDVHAAARPAPAPVSQTFPATGPGETIAGERRIPVKGVRKATAQAMVASAFSAPHVTEWVTVDVTRTVKLVRKLRELPDFADTKVSPLLLVARALLVAIARHPEINASWDEASQEIVVRDRINLGIAAATPRGLIVPNIKDAGGKSLTALAGALTELVATAREGRTSPADLARGTVTITNVGVFGVDGGTPILNPGEAAILAVGAIREQPWVHKGKVKPRQVTTLSLSFDHRMVDGELGSRVLADVAQMLEWPKLLFVRG